ncbi:hypothetical protein E6A61_09635 [Staphylococcus pseudintermedius]|nr:hypothetical protein [Staphylococcus pseudintermedius]EIQ3853013.1 hypothetical protein [Staphylococcus pseudintermedius]EIQ4463573.1 hypothetical protein [Staphylococcus pseudintermedius]HDU1418624.1 hypothetical protein [Staphylococcus pseudintermedius]
MNIKVKKEMNLPQFIEWAWENSIKHKEFTGSRNGIVEFDFRGWVRTDLIEPDEFFEVEVKEEITEETEIPILVELFVSGYGLIIHTYYRTSIREAIGEVVKGVDALPKAFYILNDDMTMTSIWKDGELIK